VVQAIGAWVVCFRKPTATADLDLIRSMLITIHAIVERHHRSSYSSHEPLLLAVGMRQSVSPSLELEDDEWDDWCRDCGGWEWIDGEIEGTAADEAGAKRAEEKNKFGGKKSHTVLQLSAQY